MLRIKIASIVTACAFALCTMPAKAVMVQIASQGIIVPQHITGQPLYEDTSGSAAAMTATGFKIVAYGRIFQKDLNFRQGLVTKSISSVSFATQTVTCAACGSTLQIDIEGVSTSSGPPGQPDGVISGGGSASGTVALTSVSQNAWVTGPTFTAPAVVHYGDLTAVVFSWNPFGSAGVFNLRANTGGGIGPVNFGPEFSSYNGTTWSTSGTNPVVNIVFNFTDGTTGSFSNAQPYSNTAQLTSYNSASNPNEIGLQFQLPFKSQTDELCVAGQISGAAGSATLELTDNAGTPNVLASVTFDGHVAQATGNINGMGCQSFTGGPVTLSANTTYNIGYLATSGTNVGIQSITFGNASDRDATMGAGANFCQVTRHNAAWSACTTTSRPQIAFVINAVDDGTGP